MNNTIAIDGFGALAWYVSARKRVRKSILPAVVAALPTAMKPVKPHIVLLILAAVLPITASAQGGSRGALVLELPASARALALGDAYPAVAADHEAIFYNPAQIGAATRAGAGLSVQRYVMSSTLAAASGAVRLGRGTLALGVQALDYGSESEIVPDPAFGGERGIETGARISAADAAITVGYAVRLGRGRIGLAGKIVRQQIAEADGSAGALDLGGALDVAPWLTLSAAVQHVGRDIELAGSRAPLPRTLRIGAAMPVRELGPLSVMATAEASNRGGSTRVSGGTEVILPATRGVGLVLRGGFLSRASGTDANPVTLGGGLLARSVAIDYAYQGFETIGGATHRVGVRWWR